MHLFRTAAVAALALVLGGALSASAATKILVGASPTPHAEILKEAAAILKPQGGSFISRTSPEVRATIRNTRMRDAITAPCGRSNGKRRGLQPGRLSFSDEGDTSWCTAALYALLLGPCAEAHEGAFPGHASGMFLASPGHAAIPTGPDTEGKAIPGPSSRAARTVVSSASLLYTGAEGSHRGRPCRKKRS